MRLFEQASLEQQSLQAYSNWAFIPQRYHKKTKSQQLSAELPTQKSESPLKRKQVSPRKRSVNRDSHYKFLALLSKHRSIRGLQKRKQEVHNQQQHDEDM